MQGFIFFVLILLLLLGYYLMYTAPTIHSKFKELGDMTGMSYAEIVASVGKPYSVSYYSDLTIAVWHEGGFLSKSFEVTIRFTKNGEFDGILSQHIY